MAWRDWARKGGAGLGVQLMAGGASKFRQDTGPSFGGAVDET